MELDRNKQPELFDIEMPDIPQMQSAELSNGVQLHTLYGGTQPVVKIDISMPGGTLRAPKALQANATNTLIAEGSKNRTSKEIADALDFYGANISETVTLTGATLSIMSVTKHLPSIMPVIEEFVKEPAFPQSEFDLWLDTTRQDYQVKQQRTSYLAACEARQMLYADGCRIGRTASLADVEALTRNDIADFHARNYSAAGTQIFVSGCPDAASIDAIASAFGANWKTAQPAEVNAEVRLRDFERRRFVPCRNAQQASITMVLPLFNNQHPDMSSMTVLNTIFGGYFGSRLMQNIREEKGLTYGIQSAMRLNKFAGELYISSAVRPDMTRVVTEEIFAEMQRLRTEPVPHEELELVRNYLKGDIQRMFENTMASADTLTNLRLNEREVRTVKEHFDNVKRITQDEIMELANIYLVPDNFRIAISADERYANDTEGI